MLDTNNMYKYGLLRSYHHFTKMRLSTLVNILTLCVLVSAYKNNEERVVLIAPVLAPNKNPRARVIETAKDFPIVKLLSLDNTTKVSEVHKVAEQPIYVEKLEDQKKTLRRNTGSR